MPIREKSNLMDWSKAKTYLIIAFAVTNIFLIFSIASEHKTNSRRYFFSEESLSNLEYLLRQKEILLNAELPKKTPKMGLLEVGYEEVLPRDYQALIDDFPGEVEILFEKQLRLMSKRALAHFDAQEALSDASAFILQYGLAEDFSLRNTVVHPDYIQIIYNASYEGMFLEGSRMEFIYQKSGNFYMERTKLKVLKKSPKKRLTKTSVEAVMQASAKIGPGETIEAIELGYYYEEYNINPLSKMKTATAFPSWRIRTDLGQFYHIQAVD